MTKTTKTLALMLTEPQRQLITAAGLRSDGALAPAGRLKGKAALNVGQALIGKGLAREIRTKLDLPVWRKDAETGRSISLVLTKAGWSFVAQSVEPMVTEATSETAPHGMSDIAPATAALVTAPQKAGEVSPGSTATSGTSLEVSAPKNNTANDGEPPLTPRDGSKLAEVLTLLRRDGGSSVTELMAATGWLPHTTRAALTRLRQRGYDVTRATTEGGSVYRIALAA